MMCHLVQGAGREILKSSSNERLHVDRHESGPNDQPEEGSAQC